MKDSSRPGARTVLEIISVTATSGKQLGNGSDVQTIAVLQELGFVQLKVLQKKVSARVPGGETSFLLECDESKAKNKAFRMLRLRNNECRQIESGYTIYIQDANRAGGSIEIMIKGDRLLEWDLMCQKADKATIQLCDSVIATRGVSQSKTPVFHSPLDEAPEQYYEVEEDDQIQEEVLPPDRVAPVVSNAVVLPEQATLPLELEEEAETPPFEGAIKARVDEIIPFRGQDFAPPFSGQPRKYFCPIKLQELADSIKENGQQQPIIVMRIDDVPGKKYEITGGERRWRACQMISGKKDIWIVIKPSRNKADQHLSSMIENIHREPNTDLEIAMALQEQINAGIPVATLAKAIGKKGKSLSNVYKLLSLLKLHPDIKALLDPPTPEVERINANIGAILAKVAPEKQVVIWHEAKKQPTRGLVVRKLHELCKPHYIVQRVRKPGREDASEISRSIRRRIDKLAGILMELQAYTPEELRRYTAFEGSEKVSLQNSRLIEAGNSIVEIRNKISRARAESQGSRLEITAA